MRSLSSSNKCSTKEFAQEMQFQTKRTRRGGQTLKPVAIQSMPAPTPPAATQNTPEPPPDSATATSRSISPSPMVLDDNHWAGDIHDCHGKSTGHTRKNPGQVSLSSSLAFIYLQLCSHRQEMIS
jgi:hypothetical protein